MKLTTMKASTVIYRKLVIQSVGVRLTQEKELEDNSPHAPSSQPFGVDV